MTITTWFSFIKKHKRSNIKICDELVVLRTRPSSTLIWGFHFDGFHTECVQWNKSVEKIYSYLIVHIHGSVQLGIKTLSFFNVYDIKVLIFLFYFLTSMTKKQL